MTRAPVAPAAAPRRGFALPMALGAIAIVGALAAGLTFAADQERRVAHQILAGERALAGAELALSRAPTLARGPSLAALPIGSTLSFVVVLDPGDLAVVRVTRATHRTVWVVADAECGGGLGRARRSVAALYELTGSPAESATLVIVTKRAWNEKL